MGLADSTRALVDAGVILPSPHARGVTVWRQAGLDVIERMIDLYVETLSRIATPHIVEHPFLVPAAEHRAVFGHRANVFTATAPDGTSMALRPDNMTDNVRLLRSLPSETAVVATGGLLRRYPGATRPLYREQYIWPAIQVSQVVTAESSRARLVEHQHVLGSFLRLLCLDPRTVTPRDHLGYGRDSRVSVVTTRRRDPTVLSTAYDMHPDYTRALAVDGNLLDVGWTGKILDTLADTFRDVNGLALPSRIAPHHLIVIPPPLGTPPPPIIRWVESLRRFGIRVDVRPQVSAARRRQEEKRAFRTASPLVIGLPDDTGPWVLATRGPVRRHILSGLPGPQSIRGHLVDHDVRLMRRSRFQDHAPHRPDLTRYICPVCEAPEPDAFGTVDMSARPCPQCGSSRPLTLVSPSGRFY